MPFGNGMNQSINIRTSLTRPLTLGLMLLCTAAMTARAATITVTNTNDTGTGSLRQALATANQGDTINFNPSPNGRPQTILLTSGQLLINKRLTISGPGADLLAVDGNHASRVFYIGSGVDVTISGLTITNGLAPAPSFGGGIYNDHGTLTVSGCIISANLADAGVGGGIFNEGTLTVSGSTFSSNASWYGAGISNHWLGGSGTLTITNSTFSSNVAETEGGGIHNQGGLLTVSNSTFSNNSATYGGGGISNDDRPSAAVTFAINNSTFSGNSAGYGGGVNHHGGTLAVTNSTFSGNSAGVLTQFIYNGMGGGIYNERSVTVTASTFSGNSATVHGGGIYNAGVNLLGGPTILKIGGTILKAGSSGENIYNDDVYWPATVTSLGYNLSSDKDGRFLSATGDRTNIDPRLGPLQDNGGPTFTHLPASDSPAIDAGDPALVTDQRGPGFVRIINARADIGPVEVQVQP